MATSTIVSTVTVRPRLHHPSPRPQNYTEAEIRFLSRICTLYEAIDRISPIRQAILIRFFVPLLDSFTHFDWRELAGDLCAGKIPPREANCPLIGLLYGVDFFTLREFLDQDDPDHQLLFAAWDQFQLFITA